ncbi:hypothetical protein SBV1_1670009 [Verrucomicrobia bacterium]|nr:hypothetical protein SBV1_1670009 [Verrucomicrobiota bacterium]
MRYALVLHCSSPAACPGSTPFPSRVTLKRVAGACCGPVSTLDTSMLRTERVVHARDPSPAPASGPHFPTGLLVPHLNFGFSRP